jgi:hypothetical protein
VHGTVPILEGKRNKIEATLFFLSKRLDVSIQNKLASDDYYFEAILP